MDGKLLFAFFGIFLLLLGCIGEGEDEWVVPEERVVISLPFNKGTTPNTLIPMGETLEHPKPQNPNGHSGIDLLWYSDVGPEETDIIACADGEVVAIFNTGIGEGDDISIRSGGYLVQYGHMRRVNPELSVGDFVEQGDYLGKAANMHWAFGYYHDFEKRYPEYLCPLTYIDEESREILEGVPIMGKMEEAGFDEICSGDYANLHG